MVLARVLVDSVARVVSYEVVWQGLKQVSGRVLRGSGSETCSFYICLGMLSGSKTMFHSGFHFFNSLFHLLVEGSLEVKLPTICGDGKAEVGRVREEKSRSEKIREGESQKREDAGARKGRKVAIHCVFPMIRGPEGRKVTSLKRRARSQLVR